MTPPDYTTASEIDWPWLRLDLECPDCTSPMEANQAEWTTCPNEECQAQLFVLTSGLVRRRLATSDEHRKGI